MLTRSETERPASEALRQLLAEHGLTYRALATRTRDVDPESRGVGHTFLVGISQGTSRPTRRSLELIAAAIGIDPSYFAEYRLALARAELDEREVGLDAALRRLVQLNGEPVLRN